MNPGSIGNIARILELNRRILFTFALLAVYRVGCAVPTPGIDVDEIRRFFEEGGGRLLGFMNLFTGGALEQLSIFALGIMPYISASIILQILRVVIPKLEELAKEGEEGRRTITRYTRYGTVGLALVQGFMLAIGLESGAFGARTVLDPGWGFRIMATLTLSAGTVFLMWLGEQITERGIGNGISLIIFSGIVVGIPSALTQLGELVRTDQITLIGALLLVAFTIATTGAVVHLERSQRRIPIQYARRVVGRREVAGGMTYFPLRLNTSGVIPPIFASSLLMFPVQIAEWTGLAPVRNFVTDYLGFGGYGYNSIYVVLIVFFAFFYTGIMINPDDVADNIKRNGGYIPGIRPGKRTAEYIQRVLNRITVVGAIYLSVVCVLPTVLIAQFGVPFYFGGTALLICVGVAMDTVGQIEAHLVSRNYETFIQGGGRIRGRSGR